VTAAAETVSFLSPEQRWTVAGYFEDQHGGRVEGWALYREREIVAIFHNGEKTLAERCADALNDEFDQLVNERHAAPVKGPSV
jgi:hypothetical protein